MLKKIRTSGLVWCWLTLVVVLLDRFSKIWVVDHLIPYDPYYVLSIFNLTLAYNTGAAFSLFHNASGWQHAIFLSITLVVSAVVIYTLRRSPSRSYWLNIALSLILGGAIGNAWDRIQYGYVIDYLDFHLGAAHFAIFNVADSAICVGAAMLIWRWLRMPK